MDETIQNYYGSLCPENPEYTLTASVTTKESLTLTLESKAHYDEATQTQFSPGIYSLYCGKELKQREFMDFQTHLYRFGEMEGTLRELGFAAVKTYCSLSKDPAVSHACENFLFECSLEQ